MVFAWQTDRARVEQADTLPVPVGTGMGNAQGGCFKNRLLLPAAS